MQPHTAFTPRTSIRQRVGRILSALVLALAAFLFCVGPALADDKSKSADNTLVNAYRYILGPVEVHLVFTDTDGKQQDYSLADTPPDFLKKLPPLLQAESKSLLLQPKVRFFDGLWLANRDAICKEAVTFVQRIFPAGSPHQAYQAATYLKEPPLTEWPLQIVALVQASLSLSNGIIVVPGSFVAPACRDTKIALMSAYVDPNAPAYFPKYNSMGVEIIPVGGYPTGKVRQLQIQLSTPALNMVPFTLTTPCTCHDPNLTCDKDPDFTMFFEVTFNVLANSTELDSWKFGPKPQMHIEYYIGKYALAMRGGYEKQVAQLEAKLEHDLAIDAALISTDEFSWVAAVAQFFEILFKYGVGGLYALSCDSEIYRTVDAGLSGEFNTSTVVQMANTASEAFKTLFVALDSANGVGFTKLDIEEGSKSSLLFKLTYPAPAKPELKNAVAASNKGIHLLSPSIGTGGQQVKPGVPFMVEGNNFLATYTSYLEIIWNKTVFGPAVKTKLQWGPQGGKMQDVDAPALALCKFTTPHNLKPGTAYRFRVHECDPISCAPWSDWLTTSTQGTGSNEVTIWLDNKSAQPVGTGVIQPNGSFLLKVTLPTGTSPGTHTLNAASGARARGRAGDRPQASVDITVAGAGGPGPSISVIDSHTRTAVQPPINLLYPSTVALRGNNFAPGAVVTLHLDSPRGPKLGTATPGKLGMFVGNFQIPMTSTGNHQIVAVQAAGGKTLRAVEEVALASQPK